MATWRVLDLFSGIGLMSLGLGWAGMRTVGFCEIEPACRFWLRRHWPAVPIFEDVKQLTGEVVRERCGPVDLLAGGFPCQPVSVAGTRQGEADARWLWPEMFRLVREVRPRWVLAENVPGLRTLGADGVLEDLEGEGYSCWSFVVGADDTGAPHRRKRVWILAHAGHEPGGAEHGHEPGSEVGRRSSTADAAGPAEPGRAGLDEPGRERGAGLPAPQGHRLPVPAGPGAPGMADPGDVSGDGEPELRAGAQGADGQGAVAPDLGPGVGYAAHGPEPDQHEGHDGAGHVTAGGVVAAGAGAAGRAVRGDPAARPAGGGHAGAGSAADAGLGDAEVERLAVRPDVGRDVLEEQPAAVRAGDPTRSRGVVSRPGHEQQPWEFSRLAYSAGARRGQPGLRPEPDGAAEPPRSLEPGRPRMGGGPEELADPGGGGRRAVGEPSERTERPDGGGEGVVEPDGGVRGGEPGGHGDLEGGGGRLPGPEDGRAPDGEGHAEPGLGGPAHGRARRLARRNSAARRARLRAWGNGVYAPLVAEIGAAIMRTGR